MAHKNMNMHIFAVLHLITSTQYKIKMQQTSARQINKGAEKTAGRGHHSYHHSWPHTELHPREQEERRFLFMLNKTEQWLSLDTGIVCIQITTMINDHFS